MINKRVNILTLLIALLLLTFEAEAQIFKRQEGGGFFSIFKKEKKTEQPVIDVHTLTIDENKNLLQIQSSIARKKIKEYMANEQKRLLKVKNISAVKLEREGEILKAVLPMEKLFLPNDVTLWNRAEMMLRPFVKYFEQKGVFHILIVTHSDNTGSIDYNLTLTSSRAEAILQWFITEGADKEGVVTYAMGGEEPLNKNRTMAERAQNRRAEIYIIPGEEMIRQAQRGKLDIK